MERYRKKSFILDVVHLTEGNIAEAYSFIHPEDRFSIPTDSIGQDKWYEYEQIVKREGMGMFTLESKDGVQFASIGDYIIKGIKGEFYPCKPDIFVELYEQVENNE